MKLPESLKIVPLLASADYGAGVSLDSIDMANYSSACIVLTFGAITGDAVLTVNSGVSAAALTSALTFNYAIGGAAIGTAVAGSTASSDVLAASTAAATLTLTGTVYATKMLVLEVDASAMDTANDENWLTVAISSAATNGIMHAVAILTPRYGANRSATSLA